MCTSNGWFQSGWARMGSAVRASRRLMKAFFSFSEYCTRPPFFFQAPLFSIFVRSGFSTSEKLHMNLR